MAQTKKAMALKLKPKETDEFISFSTKLLEFAQRNLTAILIGLAVLHHRRGRLGLSPKTAV